MNKALVQALRSKGRGGDTDVVHVNEREKSVLRAMGGAGTVNPHTGLEEYRFLGDVGKFMGLGGKSGHWSRIFNPLTQTKDFTGAPFSQKVLPVAAGIVGGIYGGPLGAGAASAAASAATNAAAEKSGSEIGRSALISGIGGLAGGALSGLGGLFSGTADAGLQAGTETAADTAGQATTQGLLQSAEQIGSQLGGETALQLGANVGGTTGLASLPTSGLAQGFTETAAKEAAADAVKHALTKKLLVAALKTGGKALTKRQETPNYLPPDFPQATPPPMTQGNYLSGPGSQYNKLVYGY